MRYNVRLWSKRQTFVTHWTTGPPFFCAGLPFLHELWDGPAGQRSGRGQLLHLPPLHAQKHRTTICSQDSQQAVQVSFQNVFFHLGASHFGIFIVGCIQPTTGFSGKKKTKKLGIGQPPLKKVLWKYYIRCVKLMEVSRAPGMISSNPALFTQLLLFGSNTPTNPACILDASRRLYGSSHSFTDKYCSRCCRHFISKPHSWKTSLISTNRDRNHALLIEAAVAHFLTFSAPWIDRFYHFTGANLCMSLEFF